MNCSISQCDGTAISRGWCKKHYRRWQRHGDPLRLIGYSGKISHGHGRSGKRSPEFIAWGNIVQRCCNPNSPEYRNYGGRGIKVCDRWRDSFTSFLADVGPRPSRKHSIDRRDNNGDYEPGNCRWVTSTVQNRNKRTNRLVIIGRDSRIIADWSIVSGVPAVLIESRLRRGWIPVRAVFTPRLNQGRRDLKCLT